MSEHILPLAVAAEHPAYAGHFPGQPILPGVVLLDETLHALAAQLGRVGAVWQLKSVKFLSPVLPGEPLVLHAVESPTGGFRFEIRCRDRRGGDRRVASGAVAFFPVPAS